MRGECEKRKKKGKYGNECACRTADVILWLVRLTSTDTLVTNIYVCFILNNKKVLHVLLFTEQSSIYTGSFFASVEVNKAFSIMKN